jgi:hypothetical protein
LTGGAPFVVTRLDGRCKQGLRAVLEWLSINGGNSCTIQSDAEVQGQSLVLTKKSRETVLKRLQDRGAEVDVVVWATMKEAGFRDCWLVVPGMVDQSRQNA